ncbi:TIGR03986 family CRISPR-associated RAMP protein [Campylobacter sp. RM16190]|uniref:TIGR03986 family type III CRISPR-associated RAMP protein n=1 Tax=Campylobacter sp. RM16190 TaxID=1705727 RepID=UPI0014739001|nr:TIGR03986 family CRISPR-associated RAMP protein [Campylobacter sp. RM16190]
MIAAPYNFVPLNDKVFYPSWADKISHDIPFEDGESGVIELEITAQSPIFIRNHGKDETSSSEFCHFMDNGKKQYYIPATSIKGMLRNVLEIMSFSAMNFIDNKKYSMRDLKNDAYKQKVVENIRCGWFFKDKDNEYKIQDCGEVHRIHYSDIGDKFGLKDYKEQFLRGKFDEKASPLKNACRKYEIIGFDKLKNIYSFKSSGLFNGRKMVKFDNNGELKGKIVLTGHPSGRDEVGKKASGKILDFVFIERNNPEILNVSKETFENFKFAYFDGRTTQPKESVDWSFWKHKLKNGEQIPVFFHKQGKEVTSFGLSYLYKFPFNYSTKDALLKIQKNEDKIDLSEAIFGYSKKIGKTQSLLKGRVYISHAKQDGKVNTLKEREVLLGSPKASYYPNYISQNGKEYKTFNDSDAEIAGFKRYPVHKIFKMQKIEKSTQTSLITPIDTGAKFKFKIVFHNLLPIELGALLSAIKFHEVNGCYHSIGMAKPYGYGKIKLDIVGHSLSNDIKHYLKSFESAMNSEIFNGEIKWHESMRIKNLFSMASEQNNNSNSKLEYMQLQDFAKSKNTKDYLKRYVELNEIRSISPKSLSDKDSIDLYRQFIQKQTEQNRLLQEKLEKEAKEKEFNKATESMSEFDKRLYKILKENVEYANIPSKNTAVFKIISETKIFDDMKHEALCKLREMLKIDKEWKEETNSKKPQNDRIYQRTLKVKEMLKEFEK